MTHVRLEIVSRLNDAGGDDEIGIEECSPAPQDVQDIIGCLLDLAVHRAEQNPGSALTTAHELIVRVSGLPEVRALKRIQSKR